MGGQGSFSGSNIATLMTTLTQKGQKFTWTEACENIFKELKERLTTALVLIIPQGTTGFAIYYDASKLGLGAVLIQH